MASAVAGERPVLAPSTGRFDGLTHCGEQRPLHIVERGEPDACQMLHTKRVRVARGAAEALEHHVELSHAESACQRLLLLEKFARIHVNRAVLHEAKSR
jgi:hypothetical protein